MLGLGLFSILVLLFILIFGNENISINAQNEKIDGINKNEKNNGCDFTTIKTKINLNNVNIKNYHHLKLVGYLNGEGQTIYFDLKEINGKINLKDNSLTVNLKFNKSNDISQVMFDDEYYVCGYVIDDKFNAANTKSNLTLYDCDEGNIQLNFY